MYTKSIDQLAMAILSTRDWEVYWCFQLAMGLVSNIESGKSTGASVLEGSKSKF